jgi:hypothetical protein
MWYREEHSITRGSAVVSLRKAAPARSRPAARPPRPAPAIRAVPEAPAGQPLRQRLDLQTGPERLRWLC